MPEQDGVELEMMSTLKKVWQHLDLEYGQVHRLAAEQIELLHTFQLPRDATTNGAKFRALNFV